MPLVAFPPKGQDVALFYRQMAALVAYHAGDISAAQLRLVVMVSPDDMAAWDTTVRRLGRDLWEAFARSAFSLADLRDEMMTATDAGVFEDTVYSLDGFLHGYTLYPDLPRPLNGLFGLIKTRQVEDFGVPQDAVPFVAQAPGGHLVLGFLDPGEDHASQEGRQRQAGSGEREEQPDGPAGPVAGRGGSDQHPGDLVHRDQGGRRLPDPTDGGGQPTVERPLDVAGPVGPEGDDPDGSGRIDRRDGDPESDDTAVNPSGYDTWNPYLDGPRR